MMMLWADWELEFILMTYCGSVPVSFYFPKSDGNIVITSCLVEVLAYEILENNGI